LQPLMSSFPTRDKNGNLFFIWSALSPPMRWSWNRGSWPLSGVSINCELHRGATIYSSWPYINSVFALSCADLRTATNRPVICHHGGCFSKQLTC
jgi:hypothetical protein